MIRFRNSDGDMDYISRNPETAPTDPAEIDLAIEKIASSTPGWTDMKVGDQTRILFERLAFKDESHARLLIDCLMEGLNQTPHEDFGGLTPDQVHTLLNSDWIGDRKGIRLNKDLAAAEVRDTTIMQQARVFLEALAEGGTPATTAGNLNRKFVGRMIETMDYPPGFLDDLHYFNKVINESDVPPLEELRVLMQVAGLVRLAKRKFTVTRNGRGLMTEGREGELYHLLFLTMFRKFNLAFSDRMPEWFEFQQTIGFGLYRLTRLDDRWHRLQDTFSHLILPAVADKLPRNEYIDYREFLVGFRLLRPLGIFGLVETKGEPREGQSSRSRAIVFFRKTELLGRFLGFEI